MKKRLVLIASGILSLILLFGNVAGCTASSPIVGTWQATEADYQIQFTTDGKVLLEYYNSIYVGTYQIISKDVVQLNFDRSDPMYMWVKVLVGNGTWQYSVSGNKMSVVGGGITRTLTRIQTFGSTTPSKQIVPPFTTSKPTVK